MTLTLPDTPAVQQMTAEDVRMELACSLFAQGKASSLAAAEIAGVDYDTFQEALHKRRIPRYTVEMLREDIESLNKAFPANPLPVPSV